MSSVCVRACVYDGAGSGLQPKGVYRDPVYTPSGLGGDSAPPGGRETGAPLGSTR